MIPHVDTEEEESMELTDETETEKLPLLTPEEFAGAFADVRLTDSVEEDTQIRKELLRKEEMGGTICIRPHLTRNSPR